MEGVKLKIGPHLFVLAFVFFTLMALSQIQKFSTKSDFAKG